MVGGKRKLLPELLRLMPKSSEWKSYHEPFLGGGALFFALASRGMLKGRHSILSDTNEELINAYWRVVDSTEPLIDLLQSYKYEEKFYYATRASRPKTSLEKVARFLYLNRVCFNGLYRVNAKGQFNVPFGKYTNPTICDADNLRAVSQLFGEWNEWSVGHNDFEVALDWTKKGDFVYLDPPYVPVSKTSSFTGYASGGFTERDQERLASAYRKHAKRGVKLMLSNSNTQLVRELYSGWGFDFQEVQAPRSVNSKADKRGNVTELVIRSWVKS
jgi:DNA adenine methylase